MRTSPSHRSLTFSVTAALLGLGSISSAAVVDRTWDGGGDNTSWNQATNWNPDDVPDTFGVNGERAVIGSTTVNRNIVTPSISTTIQGLTWTQTDSAINKLTLGANLTLNGVDQLTLNNTGASALMMLDLNGKTFFSTVNSGSVAGELKNITVQTSAAGGTYRPQGARTNTGAIIGAGVTIKPTVATSTFLVAGSFDPTSTLNFSAGLTTTLNSTAVPIGNFEVGVAGVTSEVTFNGGIALTAAGSVTVANNGSSLKFVTPGVAQTLAVGGDFTDTNTGAGYAGGSNATIAFYGSPSTARTVNITRTNIGSNLRVGDNGADTGGSTGATNGNIKLASDLTTSGTFTIRGSSAVNVDTFTLSTGNFTANAAAIFSYTAGADPGLIQISGNLNLNNFVLNLVNDGSWNHGSDLILMTYTGTLSGTPGLTFGSVPSTMQYDQFIAAGGVVKLTNVLLPEPATLGSAVLMLGASLCARCRRIA